VAATRISVRLKNVSLMDAISYITGVAGLSYELDAKANAIVVLRAPVPARPHETVFYTKEWWPKNEWLEALGANSRSSGAIRGELVEQGVSFPEGSELEWFPKTGNLIVRNTRINLDRLNIIISGNPIPESLEPDPKAAPASEDNPSIAVRVTNQAALLSGQVRSRDTELPPAVATTLPPPVLSAVALREAELGDRVVFGSPTPGPILISGTERLRVAIDRSLANRLKITRLHAAEFSVPTPSRKFGETSARQVELWIPSATSFFCHTTPVHSATADGLVIVKPYRRLPDGVFCGFDDGWFDIRGLQVDAERAQTICRGRAESSLPTLGPQNLAELKVEFATAAWPPGTYYFTGRIGLKGAIGPNDKCEDFITNRFTVPKQ
jgi:hypothetical protein